jgi:hypothetical protein
MINPVLVGTRFFLGAHIVHKVGRTNRTDQVSHEIRLVTRSCSRKHQQAFAQRNESYFLPNFCISLPRIGDGGD